MGIAQSFHSLFLFNVVLDMANVLQESNRSYLILLKKFFIYYQSVKRLSLCNFEVSSDRGEQDEKSPVQSSNPDSAATSQNLVQPTF